MLRLIICSLFGHKPMKLEVLDGHPLIEISDQSGPLIAIQMCKRCGLIYWGVYCIKDR